jgi:hypothetical protein
MSGAFDWSAGSAVAAAAAVVVAILSLVVVLAKERTTNRRAALRDITTSELAEARDRVGLAAYSGIKPSIERLRRDSFLVLWSIQRMTSVPTRAFRISSRRDQNLLREHLHQLVKALERAGASKDPWGYRHAASLARPVVERLARHDTQALFFKAFPLARTDLR